MSKLSQSSTFVNFLPCFHKKNCYYFCSCLVEQTVKSGICSCQNYARKISLQTLRSRVLSFCFVLDSVLIGRSTVKKKKKTFSAHGQGNLSNHLSKKINFDKNFFTKKVVRVNGFKLRYILFVLQLLLFDRYVLALLSNKRNNNDVRCKMFI